MEAILDGAKQETEFLIAFGDRWLDFNVARAWQEYADAIGMTVPDLTGEQKREAILNAVIA